MYGEVVLINNVAEELTGWTQEEAYGKPLQEVFSIVNEITRVPCENPVEKVLGTGGIVGLANHTALVGGTEPNGVLPTAGRRYATGTVQS